MLFINDEIYEYKVPDVSIKKIADNGAVVLCVDKKTEVVLSEKECSIWKLITNNYEKKHDISDLVLADQFCKLNNITLNNMYRIVREVHSCLEKFISWKLITIN